MAMTARLWSINGLATELGRDRRTISNALKIVPADGLIENGHKGWLMSTALQALSGGVDGEGLDLNAERARKAKEEADRLEMQNAVMRGELLERENVDAAVVGAFARVKARLLAVPAKVAPVVVRADLTIAAARIRDAIEEALHELADTTVADLCGDDGRLVGDSEAPAEADGEPVGRPGASA